jgi:hypothetical protein
MNLARDDLGFSKTMEQFPKGKRSGRCARVRQSVLAAMTKPQAELKRFLAQRSYGSFGHFGNLYDRGSRFRVRAQLFDIGFGVLPTHDLLSRRLCHVKLLIFVRDPFSRIISSIMLPNIKLC